MWITLFNRTPYDHRVFRPELFYEFRELYIGSVYGTYYITLFLKNIALFIPLGFLLCSEKSWWIVLSIGCAFSSFIEATQYVTMLGDCEIDDVIANTIGTVIGIIIYTLITKIHRKLGVGHKNA